MHRTLLTAIIIMICTGAVLCLIQLWATIIPWDIFIKTMITLGILTVLAGLVLVIKSDMGNHKQMKDENYLD